MTFVDGAVQRVTFPTFEESAAAFAAVATVEGPDHRLLLPTASVRGGGTSLLDELYRDPDAEPQEFDGEDTAIILGSLRTVAEEQSGKFLQRPIVLRMLSKAYGDTQPSSLEPITLPKPAIAPEIHQQASQETPKETPNTDHGIVVRGHVELYGFDQLVAASLSVRAFARRRDRPTVAKLGEAIEGVDPFKPEALVYSGAEARIISRALRKAAERGTEPQDASAAAMLQAGENLSLIHI